MQACRFGVSLSSGCDACCQVRKLQQTLISDAEGDLATDMKWDPLSRQYLLVAWKSGKMVLYDVETALEVRYLGSLM